MTTLPEFLAQPPRHLFFTGKGGVGKTSVACATALALAHAGKRVLLVSTDPASNLDEVLATPLASAPRAIAGAPGLMAQNLDPNAAAHAYRERMVTLLAFGVLLVVGLVAWRYRRPKLIALAVVPAVLGAFCTIAVLGLCGIDLTLLSLVALLMVVSMGVDYGIFLAEDEEHPGARGATQLGVVVDGLTTILGFGLLAISSHPALFSIGATAGVGVTLCLVLALCFGSLVATSKSHP